MALSVRGFAAAPLGAPPAAHDPRLGRRSITAHLFLIAAVNHLPAGYQMGLFVLLGGAVGCVFFTMKSMLVYGGFTIALALVVALVANAPADARAVLGAGRGQRGGGAGALGVPSRDRAARAAWGSWRTASGAFARLAMSAPVGIYRCDLQARCTFANQEWCELAGVSAEEAMGAGWAQAVHPDDRERCQKLWLQASVLGTEWEAEFRFLHNDGTVRWVVLARGDRRR